MRGFIPMLAAGNGEKRTLALAARYGDACNVFGNPAEVRRKFEVLDRHCERAGRDPSEITAALHVPNIMITKYRWTANTPRTHITNQ